LNIFIIIQFKQIKSNQGNFLFEYFPKVVEVFVVVFMLDYNPVPAPNYDVGFILL